MFPFTYARATTVAAAINSGAGHRSDRGRCPGTDFFAGGTDMMQLMSEHLRDSACIVDISRLPDIDRIEVLPDRLRLGALAKLSDTAEHSAVRAECPAVAEALLASASAQVRNVATLGGNLLQRTRCGYFRDPAAPCNKRDPGSGCPALVGPNRLHAVLGGSEHCIATYAGDLANALLPLDATLRIIGPGGERTIPLAELHYAPADTPEIETQLEPGELILSIDIPTSPAARRSHYLKVRDRASFEWSIASAAVALELDVDGRVQDVRIAVGGVATIPWRLPQVEAALLGRRLTKSVVLDAAMIAAEGAVPRGRNAYKIELMRRTVRRAIEETAGLA